MLVFRPAKPRKGIAGVCVPLVERAAALDALPGSGLKLAAAESCTAA